MPLDSPEFPRWKAIQEGLCKITGISLLTYDAKTPPILTQPLPGPGQDNRLCRLLQEKYHQMEKCNAHCGRQIVLAAQNQEPSMFTCYAHLNVFSIPVAVDQDIRMVLLGGKTFSSYEDFSKFRDLSEELDMDPQELLREVKEISFRDPEYLKTATRLIRDVGTAYFEGHQYQNRFEKATTRLMSLFNVCAELNRVEKPRDLYTLLLSAIGILFNVETASILIREEDHGGFKTTDAFGAKKALLENYRAPADEGLFERLVEKRQPISCKVVFELLKVGMPREVSSVHLIPILKSEEVTGALAIFNTALRDEDVQVLSNLSEFLGLILEKRQLQQQLRDRHKDLAVINQIMQSVSSPLESEALFDAILDKCIEVLEAEQGSLLLTDPETGALSIKAIRGLNHKIVELIRIKPGEGISGRVYADGQPMVVRDIETDPRTARQGHARYRSRSFISLPLQLGRGRIGVINLADKTSGEPFTEADAALLNAIANYAAVAIERSEYYQKSEELKKISITDSLTGLLNRRYFQERLAEEVERSKRHHLPVSLIIMDIDDFKKFNDHFGHPAGDEALKTTGRALRNTIRAIDVAARYGGEEFTVILPQTAKDDAMLIAERFCREIESINFQTDAEQVAGTRLTVSIGLASCPEDTLQLDELIKLADTALYAAKAQGKNRVVVYDKGAQQETGAGT